MTVAIFLGVAGVFRSICWCGAGGECSAGDLVAKWFTWSILQWAMVATAVLASMACVALGDFTERTWKTKDPGRCTVDEVAGQAVALLGMPILYGWSYWHGWLITAGVCFALFRVMDILKPPPVRQFEKLPKGWGVLLDDLMAGVYANLAAQAILRAGIL